MIHVAQFMMLASVFVISFVNPSAMGKPLYYALFPYLAFWVWVFYYCSYVVTEKQVRAVRKEPFNFSCLVGMVPQVGSGDLIRGRLVITEGGLFLYSKEKKVKNKVPVSLSWHLDAKEIKSLGVGPVLAKRPGVIFYLDEGDVRFVFHNAVKQKDAMVAALGWKHVPMKPEGVSVGDEAASAPSFSTVNEQHTKNS